MKLSLSTLNLRSLSKPLLVAASIALASCAAPPQARLLSRLPASHPDAAATSVETLSKSERKNYAEIDKQVLEEQQQAIAKDREVQAYYNRRSAPIGYYGYYHHSPSWRLGFPFDPIWWW